MKVKNGNGNVKQVFKIAVVGTRGFMDDAFVLRRLENIVLPKTEEYDVILKFDDVPGVCVFAYGFAEEHGMLNIPCIRKGRLSFDTLEVLEDEAQQEQEIELLAGTNMVVGFLEENAPKYDDTKKLLEKAKKQGSEVVSFMYDPRALEEDIENEHQ